MKKSLGPKTLLYPLPVLIVCTYDTDGRANAMAVSWGGICCSQPPAVGISVRKATYTYGCIVDRKAFTVNIPPERYVREADYFGIASGKHEDKFAVSGLTPVKAEHVDAPYIGEFPLILECKLIHTVEIGLHTQFIGEIMDVKAEEEVLCEKGFPLIKNVKPFTCSPSDRRYYAIGESIAQAWSVGKELSDRQ
jgi:flavin reductase (DIM6/NTAB) family NADH-FMN oxidoreductase RutF